MKYYRVFKDGTPVNGVIHARTDRDAVEQVFKKLEDLSKFSGISRSQLVAKEVYYGDTKS